METSGIDKILDLTTCTLRCEKPQDINLYS